MSLLQIVQRCLILVLELKNQLLPVILTKILLNLFNICDWRRRLLRRCIPCQTLFWSFCQTYLLFDVSLYYFIS